MTANGLLQITVFLVVLLLLVKPLGLYMARVSDGTSVVNRIFGPVERALYRVFGTCADAEMNWKTYAVALRHAAQTSTEPQSLIFSTGDLHVGLTRRQVVVNNGEVHLTPLEYKLLSTLVQHAGMVITHWQLLRSVWGAAYETETHYLRVYMAQLRHKLEKDPARPRYLVTEPGVGYRLQIDAASFATS